MATLPCLLLAEDDPVSRAFLQQALADDHTLVLAEDGPGALTAARARRFDLLLLDLNLPGVTGVELLAALRRDHLAGSCGTPALALTAEPDPEVRAGLLAAGFAAVLGKPVSIACLRQAVTALLTSEREVVEHPESSEPPADIDLPDWDDRIALRAAANQRSVVDALRPLLLGELPGQCERIDAALAAGTPATARDELHRLRAACGFCGASRLGAAVDRLARQLASGHPHAQALTRFHQAARALLSTAGVSAG